MFSPQIAGLIVVVFCNMQCFNVFLQWKRKHRKPNEAIEPEHSSLLLSNSTVVRVILGADKGLVTE